MKSANNLIELASEKYLLQYFLNEGVFNIIENISGKSMVISAYSFAGIDSKRVSTPETADRNSRTGRYDMKGIGCGAGLSVINRFPGFNLVQEFFIPDKDEAVLIRNCVECTDGNIKVGCLGVVSVDSGKKGKILSKGKPEDYRVFTSPSYKIPSILRNVYDGFNLHSLYGEINPIEPGYSEITYSDNYISDYKNRIKFGEDMGTRGQGYYEGFIYNLLEKAIMVFGFVTAFDHMPRFNLNYDSLKNPDGFCAFEMFNDCENIPLSKGETLYSEYAYLNLSSDVFGAREHFAGTMGRMMNAKVCDYPKAGWCSWHKKWYSITEQDVLAQLDFVSSNPHIFPNCRGGFEYIQVDYGWQKNCGQPEVDENKFPHGMKYLADRIHEKGFKAGIWIAPAMIEVTKGEEYPFKEYFLKNKNDEPISMEDWFGRPNHVYYLDVTHPDARKFALDQVGRIINEWGYDMIKMDFLEGGMIQWGQDPDDVVFHNRTKSSIGHLRDFCRDIADIAEKSGREIFLSPCGNPVYHMAGIFKSNYIAEDAGYMRWDEHMGVMNFAQTWAIRSNLNGRIFTNNLESVLLDDPRPLNEAKINVASAALSGGIVFIGDMLTNLSKEKLEIYSKMMPLYNVKAKPVDFFNSEISSVLDLKIKTGYEDWNIVGVFNWEDVKKDFVIDLESLELEKRKEYEVFEFWNQEYLGSVAGLIKLNNIPGRSSKLLCVREKKNHPWILSTDVHFTQGAVELESIFWDKGQMELSGVFTGKRHGDFVMTIIFPERMEIIDYKCNDGQLAASDGKSAQLRRLTHIAELRICNYCGESRNFKIKFL